ncbi:hypothetical protein D3C84_629050 [compost metagenome]
MVPRHNIQPLVGYERRTCRLLIEKLLKGRTNDDVLLIRKNSGLLLGPKHEQMLALIPVQLESPRYAIEHLSRHLNGTRLLQPRIPVHADSC